MGLFYIKINFCPFSKISLDLLIYILLYYIHVIMVEYGVSMCFEDFEDFKIYSSKGVWLL